jgi:hypothetical protein
MFIYEAVRSADNEMCRLAIESGKGRSSGMCAPVASMT